MNIHHPLDAIPRGWPTWTFFATWLVLFLVTGMSASPDLEAPGVTRGHIVALGLWGLAGLFAGAFHALRARKGLGRGVGATRLSKRYRAGIPSASRARNRTLTAANYGTSPNRVEVCKASYKYQ